MANAKSRVRKRSPQKRQQDHVPQKSMVKVIHGSWNRITEGRVGVATAGYLTVFVFLVAYGLLCWAQYVLKWITLDALILPFAALITAPVAIAFLWERLSIKAFEIFSVKIELNEVTKQPLSSISVEDVIRMSNDSHDALVDHLSNITNRINEVNQDKKTTLLKVTLRSKEPWWNTRLYIFAALAEDYTKIRQFVFVNEEECFIGFANPGDIRKKLAVAPSIEGLDKAYHENYPEIENLEKAKLNNPMAKSLTEIMIAEKVADFDNWFVEKNKKHQQPNYDYEKANKEEIITRENLKAWLGDDLKNAQVEWDQRQESLEPKQVRDIIKKSDPYVALVQEDRLKRVVDRLVLAERVAFNVVKKY